MRGRGEGKQSLPAKRKAATTHHQREEEKTAEVKRGRSKDQRQPLWRSLSLALSTFSSPPSFSPPFPPFALCWHEPLYLHPLVVSISLLPPLTLSSTTTGDAKDQARSRLGQHQAGALDSTVDVFVFPSVLFSFSAVFLPYPYSLFCYQCMSQTGRVVRLSHMARPRGSGLWPYPRACSS